MKTISNFGEINLKDVPLGLYKKVGGGLSERKKLIFLRNRKEKKDCLAIVPEYMVLTNNLEIKIVDRKIGCLIKKTRTRNKKGNLIGIYNDPTTGEPLPWFKSLLYVYQNKKWVLIQVDGKDI